MSLKDISVTTPLGLSPEAAALKPKAAEKPGAKAAETPMPPEKDGPKGPEPTRYGDWERKGRCSDF
jgi:hypothetical protein